MPETPAPQDPMIVRLPLIRFFQTEDGRVIAEVTGSTLVPPGMTNGRYLSASGYTTDVSQATDFRGAPGMTIVEGETVEVVGPAGPAGMDGESAYSAWLAAGNDGSEGDFLAALKGETGEQGPRGSTGDDGAKGDTGEAGPKGDTGATGPKGDIGLTGLTGAKGDTGSQGAQGIQGASGTPGTNGTNGTNGATWTTLPDVTLTDGGLVVSLGPRKKSFACVGALVGDRLAVFATAGTPAGYVIGDACCKIAGQIEISFYGPTLTVLVTNNIVLKVIAFR